MTGIGVDGAIMHASRLPAVSTARGSTGWAEYEFHPERNSRISAKASAVGRTHSGIDPSVNPASKVTII
jgi:hypothetical protein